MLGPCGRALPTIAGLAANSRTSHPRTDTRHTRHTRPPDLASFCKLGAGPAEILALLCHVGAGNRDGHVRDRIFDAVVEVGGPEEHVRGRDQRDAELTADQPFGPELIVRERQYRADAELPVELVERRRAEAGAEVPPDADAWIQVVARRDARAEDGVLAIRQRGMSLAVGTPLGDAFSRLWPL